MRRASTRRSKHEPAPRCDSRYGAVRVVCSAHDGLRHHSLPRRHTGNRRGNAPLSYAVPSRTQALLRSRAINVDSRGLNAGETERSGQWALPRCGGIPHRCVGCILAYLSSNRQCEQSVDRQSVAGSGRKSCQEGQCFRMFRAYYRLERASARDHSRPSGADDLPPHFYRHVFCALAVRTIGSVH